MKINTQAFIMSLVLNSASILNAASQDVPQWLKSLSLVDSESIMDYKESYGRESGILNEKGSKRGERLRTRTMNLSEESFLKDLKNETEGNYFAAAPLARYQAAIDYIKTKDKTKAEKLQKIFDEYVNLFSVRALLTPEEKKASGDALTSCEAELAKVRAELKDCKKRLAEYEPGA